MSDSPPQFGKAASELIAAFRRLPNEDPSTMRIRPTKTLSSLVDDLRVKHAIGLDSPEQLIRDHWNEIVGHANASYSHASQIDPRGRLVVLAAHSVVRNELFHHRHAIVKKVKELPGCDGVRELLLRSG